MIGPGLFRRLFVPLTVKHYTSTLGSEDHRLRFASQAINCRDSGENQRGLSVRVADGPQSRMETDFNGCRFHQGIAHRDD